MCMRRRWPGGNLEDRYDRRTAVAGWAAWSSGVVLAARGALSQFELLSHVASAGLTGIVLLSNANASARIGAPGTSLPIRAWACPRPPTLNPLGAMHVADSN